jgi:L-fuculose-phosphate aldolase
LPALIGALVSLALLLKALVLTPTGIPFYRIRGKEVVVMDLLGNVLSKGIPSSEWRLYISLLQGRPDIKAVVHAHPPFATILACAGKELPVIHDEGRLFFWGKGTHC